MSTSNVEVCNIALQKLGAQRITDLDDTTNSNARECKACFTQQRDAELRRHPWNFAIKRASLPADTDGPKFGPTNFFTLPSDFIRLLPQDPEEAINTLDWRIEGKKIATYMDAPLEIRYVYRVTDPNEFDTLFVECLASRIALHLCEKITGSNSKKGACIDDYKNALAEARRTNGIENIAQEPPADPWITARL